MNKTISINIKGLVFNIEEEAYQILERYLNRLRSIFGNEEGSEEILDDIESRIAELFSEKITNNYQAIVISDVEDIIEIMGRPEDYSSMSEEEEESETQTKSSSTSESTERSKSRRLYRDPDAAVVGGVCSGIAHYLGWEALWVRVLFILFAFSGFSILVYIILYIIVPEAASTTEKLEMKGEPVNIDNIKKKVSEGFEDTKQTLLQAKKDSRNPESKLGKFLKSILDLFVELLRLLGQLFRKAYGFIMIALGLILLVAVIGSLVTADTLFFGNTGWSLGDFQDIFIHDSGTLTLGFLGLGLVVFALLFSFLYSGIRIVFNLYERIKGVSLLFTALFILGSIMISIVVVKECPTPGIR